MSYDTRATDVGYIKTATAAGRCLSEGSERPSSTFGKIETRSALNENADALADARRLAFRVQLLVDRFCGHVPSPTQSDESKEAAMAVVILDDLRQDAQRTAYDIRRAMERLDHLEAQLP